MKILFIGDIVGRPGREAIRKLLPQIKKKSQVELVVANAENAAGGSGLTPAICEELFSLGIDLLTSGDHIWKKREILEIIDKDSRILRPANYPQGAPGAGATLLTTTPKGTSTLEGTRKTGIKVGVVNLVGRVFMEGLDCPFRAAVREVKALRKETAVIIVDVHAEATSEKQALGWFLDGQVSAVVGTHTHVQTADEKILPQGTAFITDVGMTGPFDSILGRRREDVLERFLTQVPVRFQMGKENIQLHGVIIDIDAKSGRANSIERIQVAL